MQFRLLLRGGLTGNGRMSNRGMTKTSIPKTGSAALAQRTALPLLTDRFLATPPSAGAASVVAFTAADSLA